MEPDQIRKYGHKLKGIFRTSDSKIKKFPFYSKHALIFEKEVPMKLIITFSCSNNPKINPIRIYVHHCIGKGESPSPSTIVMWFAGDSFSATNKQM